MHTKGIVVFVGIYTSLFCCLDATHLIDHCGLITEKSYTIFMTDIETMSNRRDRHHLLRYTCTYLVLLEIYYFTGVDSTICTDRANLDGFTNVLPMCRSGTLTVDRVVVDTYDTGVLGCDSCHCTVRLAQAHTVPVAIQTTGYPDTAPSTGCGSILKFDRLPGNTYIEIRCQQIPGDRYSEFAVNELVNITLSRVDNNIQWNSGYCIFIDSNKNMNVTCEEPKTAHTSSTIRLTTKAGTTTTSLSSISPIPRTTFITTDGTYRGCTCGESDLSLVAIIVTIVVSMLVVTVGTVVNILIYKRRVALVNNPKSSTSGMTAPDTVHYDSLDQARVELPNTYEEISTRQTYVNMAIETK
ncbi:uncharacterized protein [Argopecten irradians]|uniref:uncharacterized protein n=1 Tax=Argopecten irradians TaxID=31199 RepID=UPI0037200018